MFGGPAENLGTGSEDKHVTRIVDGLLQLCHFMSAAHGQRRQMPWGVLPGLVKVSWALAELVVGPLVEGPA